MSVKPTPLATRFATKHTTGPGCWEWTASLRPNGYGQIGLPGGKVAYAHRASYELHVGPIPPGMFVCHRCDNRRCVNPSHLFVGTSGDNMRDASVKGRLVGKINNRGESNPRARLTESDLPVIRGLSAAGHTGKAIAKRYRISETAISRVLSGKTWV